MAVNINIPGIGNVSASDAATESTLRALLAATQGANTIIRSNESTVAYIQAQQERSAQATNSQFGGIASSANRAGGAVSRFADDVSSGLAGVNQRTYTLRQYLVDLSSAAAALTDRFVMDYERLASDPVGSSVRTVNTLIDLTGGAISGLIGVFAGAKKDILKLDFKKIFKGAAENIGPALKYVNQFLGNQLQITLDSFQEFNRMGTVFADGMSMIRAETGRAGILLNQFTLGIRSSIDSVRAMGIGTQFGTITVARAMEQLKDATHDVKITQISANGVNQGTIIQQSTYRESLKRLGYQVDDQVALVADYMSLQRASMSAEEFRAYSRRAVDGQVAEETLNYAKNLRLIADLTGKSASEVAKEARQRQLSALAQANLDGEARKTFGLVGTVLQDEGAGYLTTALDQLVATGGQTITDQTFNMMAAQFPQLRSFVDGLYENITSGAMTAEQATAAARDDFNRLSEGMRANAGAAQDVINAAVLSGNTNNLDGLLQFLDAIMGNTMDGATVDTAVEGIEKIVNAPDKLTKELIDAGEELLKIAVEVEQATTGKILSTYASFIAKVNGTISDFVQGIGNLSDSELRDFFEGKFGDTTEASDGKNNTTTDNPYQYNPVDPDRDNYRGGQGTFEFPSQGAELSGGSNVAIAGLNGGDVLTAMKQVATNVESVATQVSATASGSTADKESLAELKEVKGHLVQLIQEVATNTSVARNIAAAATNTADSAFRFKAFG
jgi:hypothetical protein